VVWLVKTSKEIAEEIRTREREYEQTMAAGKTLIVTAERETILRARDILKDWSLSENEKIAKVVRDFKKQIAKERILNYWNDIRWQMK
jgi:hypothetical protein